MGAAVDHDRPRARDPGLPRFLLGRFFYSDAVNTVIVVMSVIAVQAVGLTEQTANWCCSR